MHCVWDKTSKSLTVRQPALSNSDPHSTAVALAPLIQLAIPGHLRSMAGLVDTSVRRDVFYSAIVLPSCVLTAYLCFRWTYLFVAVLPILVCAGGAVAEALQDFFQGKQATRSSSSSQRVQPGVMRISRSLYDQLDTDMLRLLASNRDFSESDYERLLQLDSLKHGGASESEIHRLPLVPVTEQMLQASNHAGCSICLMGVEVDSHVRLLRCFHHFHSECIDPWLKGKAECPMCKFPAIG